MIEVNGLGKEYGDLTAVDNLSLRAEPGKIFGLLGPNGAGKSTTIGCISGLLAPSRGSVKVMGHDVQTNPRAAKSELGIVPQELALYEELSARENLDYWGSAYGLRGSHLKGRIAEVLELITLADRAKEPVKKFSGGMKRRLNFGCGIIHEPRVLLLDEPTVGVDPQSRVNLLDLVREQVRRGICVLYTTHYMEEAERLCDRLAIVDHGSVIAEGTLAELRAEIGERDILRLTGDFGSEVPAALNRSFADLEVVQSEENILTLALAQASRRLPEIFAAITAAGGELRETTLTQPSLESLFIKLTGKELRQ